jgi:hypothetical protein
MDILFDGREVSVLVFDRWQILKGMVVVVMLVALFFTDIPREYSALSMAGVLLCCRKMTPRISWGWFAVI